MVFIKRIGKVWPTFVSLLNAEMYKRNLLIGNLFVLYGHTLFSHVDVYNWLLHTCKWFALYADTNKHMRVGRIGIFHLTKGVTKCGKILKLCSRFCRVLWPKACISFISTKWKSFSLICPEIYDILQNVMEVATISVQDINSENWSHTKVITTSRWTTLDFGLD